LDANQHDLKTAYLNIAMRQGIPDGWRTFSAAVFDFTWKEDFILQLWYEEDPRSVIIRPARAQTCPCGRTFLWHLGNYLEPEGEESFVSGLFAGGTCRLFHCNVEIMPPKLWLEKLKWKPELTDPFTWTLDGKLVARYERLHGRLRRNAQAPQSRQPVLHRWLVSNDQFGEIERIIGGLRLREEFTIFPFDTD
jgi:hypothetical protein